MKTPYILLIAGILVFALVFVFLRNSPAPDAPAVEAPAVQTAVEEAPIRVPPVAAESPAPIERRTPGPLYEKDDAGNTWRLELASSRGYRSDGPQPGPPIIVKADVQRRSAREYSIGLVLTGQAGETYRPVVQRNGQSRPAPRLKIVNEAGEVLVDNSFAYG